ncbi:MAG: preprotein translocase subunit SecE [Peptococcaceae bacterium]|nr:preprotein translocase subunit SecE [Peptococcaceae bacterium]
MALTKKSDRSKGDGGFLKRAKQQPSRRSNYFREVWLELKKVHWPSRNQLLTYTGVVLVAVGICAVLIWIVDSALTYGMTVLLGS